jgi:hypothetical protein
MQALPIGASSWLQPPAAPLLLPLQLPRQPASIATHDRQSQGDMLSSKPPEQPGVSSMWWECNTFAVSGHEAGSKSLKQVLCRILV